ncbi:MAG TPA: hypothetical protein ENN40_01190 [Candidatus Aminicenantes bacterium]|nr:hypothetical protein [Candidatus Aminicenantes bacterium]
MNPATIFAVFMALLAYSCIAGGEMLMKVGISWLGWRGPKTSAYFRSRRLWVAGLVLANLYGIPSAVALKYLPPHIVGAFSGWVVVLLVILSHRVLGEPLTRNDGLFAFLFVVGFVFLNLLDRAPGDTAGASSALWGISLLPVAVFGMGFARGLPKRSRAVLFGAVAGMSAGLMVVFLRLLVLEFGFDVARYFSSAYLYLYVFFALLSLAALQLALKKAGMIQTASLKYSTNILYPFLAAPLVFQTQLSWLHWALAALIVFSVVRLIRHR